MRGFVRHSHSLSLHFLVHSSRCVPIPVLNVRMGLVVRNARNPLPPVPPPWVWIPRPRRPARVVPTRPCATMSPRSWVLLRRSIWRSWKGFRITRYSRKPTLPMGLCWIKRARFWFLRPFNDPKPVQWHRVCPPSRNWAGIRGMRPNAIFSWWSFRRKCWSRSYVIYLIARSVTIEP